MQDHDKRSVQFILFTSLIIVTIFSFPLSSYADKMITLQKTSDVREESLLNTISDVSQYSKIFPDNVKHVKILDNNTRLVDIDAGINGIFFDTQAICKIDPNGDYVVEVISGDLKGTIMTTNLEKTWGFHGQKDGGTIANISLDVKTSGLLAWMINLVPDSSVSDALEYGFDRFVQQAQIQQL